MLISAFIVLAAWSLSLLLSLVFRVSSYTTRNLLHILAGLWGLLWLFFQSQILATALAGASFLVLLTIGLIRSRFPSLDGLTSSFAWGKEGIWGVVSFAFALTIITYFLWPFKEIGTACIFALALGDGMADAVGRRWGRIRYKLPWNKGKTLTGSLACFSFSVVGIYLSFALFKAPLDFYLFLGGGFLCALVEAISPSQTDNLFIPLTLTIFLFSF